MITAFIDVPGRSDGTDARPLARTLAGLVPATVDGLLREVVLVAPAGDETAKSFADHSGGDCVDPSGFQAALASARGDWVLFLEAGVLLEPGWLEQVSLHMQGGHEPARFSRSPHAPRPLLARYLSAERPLALGLLAPRAQMLLLARRAPTMAGLAAAARPRRLAASLRPAF